MVIELGSEVGMGVGSRVAAGVGVGVLTTMGEGVGCGVEVDSIASKATSDWVCESCWPKTLDGSGLGLVGAKTLE